MNTTPERLHDLVQRHAALALPDQADRLAEPASASANDLAYAAARRLGFIEPDAAAIARAWQRRSEREGRLASASASAPASDWNPNWPTEAQDFGLLDPPTEAAPAPPFAPCPAELGLYAVLPSAAWVQRMAQAGVPTLQLRFKSGHAAAVRAEVQAAAAAVQAVASASGQPPSRLFINDHWQAALEAGAYGVHLGQEDLDTLPPDALPALRRAGLRLGLSTHGYAELLRAARLRPSYLALGAVYPTTLKAMATAPQGSARLHAYAQLLRGLLPSVAIGGIGPEQLPAVAASGVGSFAVVRALTSAAEPEAAARALMQRWAQLRAA
ncbi:thiamine monophosphate synthase [Serpentinimonas raichei]|uniref:Thiamine monophosphate synthase n=1 Tax=Serpentinimonas raichei TaxID=1458425 RepID=A0A060NH19_9BURK|nr:thiamine phosphate synthase [Serpentinimonas raichei]BAO81156.1 thiamine monophosphate synthase [Serpentinimonas raichei]